MAMDRKGVLCAAVLVGLCHPLHVTGFSLNGRPGVRAVAAEKSCTTSVSFAPDSPLQRSKQTTPAKSMSTALGASSTEAPDFGAMLGDKVASAIVNSPVYPLLIYQAKNTMKKSAEVHNSTQHYYSIIV